mgnify:CR=1 FL=1
MKNKYIYIIILFILWIIFFIVYFLFYLSENYDVSDDLNELMNPVSEKYEENKKEIIEKEAILSIEDKYIDISKKEIDPNNYESLKEFIWYLNTWSWVNLDVDMENEDFYINKELDNNKEYIKFNKSIIANIDLSNDKNPKNRAIKDIYSALLTNKLYWEATSKRSWVRFLEEHELPETSRLHNDILSPYSWKTFLQLFDDLKSKNNKTKLDIQKLAYMYDFLWEYSLSEKLKQKAWLKQINYKISWKVTDTYWNTLSWAIVTVLNLENKHVVTDDNWNYELEFNTYPLTRLRFRSIKSGAFSDAYNSSYVLYDNSFQEINNLNFSLQKQNSSFIIKWTELTNWKSKTIKSTLWNSFIFNEWVVLTKNKKTYSWDFIVKIFEFNQNTSSMDWFLNNDNFDSVYWYAWNLMKTTGMTYLLITDINGRELYISKKKPITTIQNTNLDLMINDYYDIWFNLTDNQIDIIYNESQKWGYPIDREFLLKMWIGGYSPWWVFNVEKGIWENAPFKFLNKTWLKQSLYYNAN